MFSIGFVLQFLVYNPCIACRHLIFLLFPLQNASASSSAQSTITGAQSRASRFKVTPVQEQPPTDIHGVPLDGTASFQQQSVPQVLTQEEQQALFTAEQVQSEINRQQQILHHQQQHLIQQQHQQAQQQIHLQQMQHHLNNSIAAAAAGVVPIQMPTDPNVCPTVPMTMPGVPMTMTVPLAMQINPATFAMSSGSGQPATQQPQLPSQNQQGPPAGSDFGTPHQSTPENTVQAGDNAQISYASLQNQGSIDRTSNET